MPCEEKCCSKAPWFSAAPYLQSVGLEICNRSLGLVWQVWQLVGFLFPVLRRTGILLPWVSKDAEDSLSVCLKDFKGKNIQEIDYSIALLN